MKNWRRPVWILSAFVALFTFALPVFVSPCLSSPGSNFHELRCAIDNSTATMLCCCGFTRSTSQDLPEAGKPHCCTGHRLPSPKYLPIVVSTVGAKTKPHYKTAESSFTFSAVVATTPHSLLPPTTWLTLADEAPTPTLTVHNSGPGSERAPPVG